MRRGVPRALALGAIALAAAIALGGCGGGDTATPASGFGGGYPVFRDAATGTRLVFGTPDLAVGTDRVAFVVTSPDGLITSPTLRVESYVAPGGAATAAVAHFEPFPDVERGLYALDLTFDRAGTWGLDVHVPRADGTETLMSVTFPVAARPSSVAIGDPAPASRNRTLADVSSVAALTTGTDPDPALYETRIVDALAEYRPLVVVFASPAFCTNELCGPQVEVLSELRVAYGDRAGYVHVDIYDNPDAIDGDLTRAVRSPLLAEWGVTTDEWTFIVGADGRVARRFESFVSKDALARALDEVLAASAD